jgi:ubiquinone/menaquinone biosynthesis C-methylase UbiE
MIQGLTEFGKIYDELMQKTAKVFLYHFCQQFEGIEIAGKKILDLGCGKGFTALALSSLSPATEIIALDEYEGHGESKENSQFLQHLIQRFQVNNLHLQKMDFLKNQFSDSTFDVVVANHSLHHIVRTDGFIFQNRATELAWVAQLSEVKRILGPGGVLVAKEGTRNSIWRYVPLRCRNIDWKIHPTIREFKSIFQQVFPKTFLIKNVVSYRLRKFLPFLRKNPLATFLVTPNFYIIARK